MAHFPHLAFACQPRVQISPRRNAALRYDVRPRGPSVDSARTTVASVAADSVLDPQRAVADGRDRLQHAVPLVYRIELGRRGVGRDCVSQRIAIAW